MMVRVISFYVATGLLVLLMVLIGCAQPEQKQTELNVFAAISLTDALGEIGTAFTAENGVKIFYNFAASATLQRQIEKGATADIFISASPRQVVALETNGLIETESRHDLLTNRLVLVSDDTTEITVEMLADLAAPEISRIAIGHPNIVPAGTYAKEALIHLGLWETLQSKFVFGTDVRASLAYVTAGNADVAIVYKTDTTLTRHIKVLYQLPAEAYTPIIYPAVIIIESERKQLARRFMTYLYSMESGEIFEKHGFTFLILK